MEFKPSYALYPLGTKGSIENYQGTLRKKCCYLTKYSNLIIILLFIIIIKMMIGCKNKKNGVIFRNMLLLLSLMELIYLSMFFLQSLDLVLSLRFPLFVLKHLR